MFEQRHISFFTATILYWKKLLKPDKYKQIIIESLKFLVAEKRVQVYGFVIMPNHIHLIWAHKRNQWQRKPTRFTPEIYCT